MKAPSTVRVASFRSVMSRSLFRCRRMDAETFQLSFNIIHPLESELFRPFTLFPLSLSFSLSRSLSISIQQQFSHSSILCVSIYHDVFAKCYCKCYQHVFIMLQALKFVVTKDRNRVHD